MNKVNLKRIVKEKGKMTEARVKIMSLAREEVEKEGNRR